MTELFVRPLSQNYYRHIMWSPDGQRLACSKDDGTVTILTSAGVIERTIEAHENPVTSLSWSPDGTRLASASQIKVKVWNAVTWACIRTMDGGRDSHVLCMYIVIWSPVSDYLATSSADKTVKIWDVETGLCVRTFTNQDGFMGTLAWSPDGTRVAFGASKHTVLVVDVYTGKVVLHLKCHEEITALTWSPDGTRIASSTRAGTVRIWNAVSGQLMTEISTGVEWIWMMAWSPDGSRIAFGGLSRVSFRDGNTCECLASFSEGELLHEDFDWAPDSSSLVLARKKLSLILTVGPSRQQKEAFLRSLDTLPDQGAVDLFRTFFN